MNRNKQIRVFKDKRASAVAGKVLAQSNSRD
jgi:hypothetical protein